MEFKSYCGERGGERGGEENNISNLFKLKCCNHKLISLTLEVMII